jgi:hypothetical protein
MSGACEGWRQELAVRSFGKTGATVNRLRGFVTMTSVAMSSRSAHLIVWSRETCQRVPSTLQTALRHLDCLVLSKTTSIFCARCRSSAEEQ